MWGYEIMVHTSDCTRTLGCGPRQREGMGPLGEKELLYQSNSDSFLA